MSDLLTPEETAELLGISVNTLRMWRCAKRYDLPYVKVGRLVRYREKEIQDFILRNQKQGQSLEAL
ncbi:MAG: helix-turn-helix domain-containing protein [Rickettsiales bacterium]|nr:helix-turn-helix domain-containing protein [Rickettsiales bacterium]